MMRMTTRRKQRRSDDGRWMGNGGGMVDDVDDVAQKTKTPTINSSNSWKMRWYNIFRRLGSLVSIPIKDRLSFRSIMTVSCSSNLFNCAYMTSRNDGASRDDDDDDEKETKTKRRREMGWNGGGMGDDVDELGQKTKTPTIHSFWARNARCWIYVKGLPLKTTEDEVARYFAKVGIPTQKIRWIKERKGNRSRQVDTLGVERGGQNVD